MKKLLVLLSLTLGIATTTQATNIVAPTQQAKHLLTILKTECEQYNKKIPAAAIQCLLQTKTELQTPLYSDQQIKKWLQSEVSNALVINQLFKKPARDRGTLAIFPKRYFNPSHQIMFPLKMAPIKITHRGLNPLTIYQWVVIAPVTVASYDTHNSRFFRLECELEILLQRDFAQAPQLGLRIQKINVSVLSRKMLAFAPQA